MSTPPITGSAPPPSRLVVRAEALEWLSATEAPAAASVITSLPDRTEIPGLSFDAWRAWFVEAARRVAAWVPADAVTIFYQSDVRHRGLWVDKAHLVTLGAEAAGAALAWHKVVCRAPAGAASRGRPSYSHMLAFARTPRPAGADRAPDVLPDAGHMPWIRAMGTRACEVACAYVLAASRTRTVVDPFCGYGTVLAVANRLGLDAIGVDLSAKQCRAARALVLPE